MKSATVADHPVLAALIIAVALPLAFTAHTLLQAAYGKCANVAEAQGPSLAAIVDVSSDSGRTWSIVRMIPEDSAHYFIVGWQDSTGALKAIRVRWFCPVKAPSLPQGDQ